MAKIEVIDIQRQKVAEMEVDDRLLKATEKSHLIYDVVRWQLAGKRSGTAATKERSAVSGGGKKPWKQKGTGRARVGSRRSPLWRGGAVLFGPQPRSYNYRINRKVHRLAFLSLFSSLQKEKHLFVLDQIALAEPKTRQVVELRGRLGIQPGQKVLIVTQSVEPTLGRAAANLGRDSDYPTRVLPINNLNVHELLCCDYLILPAPVVKSLEEVYG